MAPETSLERLCSEKFSCKAPSSILISESGDCILVLRRYGYHRTLHINTLMHLLLRYACLHACILVLVDWSVRACPKFCSCSSLGLGQVWEASDSQSRSIRIRCREAVRVYVGKRKVGAPACVALPAYTRGHGPPGFGFALAQIP